MDHERNAGTVNGGGVLEQGLGYVRARFDVVVVRCRSGLTSEAGKSHHCPKDYVLVHHVFLLHQVKRRNRGISHRIRTALHAHHGRPKCAEHSRWGKIHFNQMQRNERTGWGRARFPPHYHQANVLSARKGPRRGIAQNRELTNRLGSRVSGTCGGIRPESSGIVSIAQRHAFTHTHCVMQGSSAKCMVESKVRAASAPRQGWNTNMTVAR